MNDYFKKAKHNLAFLNSIETNFPDEYYDWRTTVIFYISIHLLKCLAKQRGYELGGTHEDISRALNPRKCAKQLFPFPEWVWNKYSNILSYSRTARYHGIKDDKIILMAEKRDYIETIKLFKDYQKYMKSNGIEL